MLDSLLEGIDLMDIALVIVIPYVLYHAGRLIYRLLKLSPSTLIQRYSLIVWLKILFLHERFWVKDVNDADIVTITSINASRRDFRKSIRVLLGLMIGLLFGSVALLILFA